MDSDLRRNLPAQLPPFLAAQRWFGGKARQILAVAIDDSIPIGSGETRAVIFVVTVKYLEGAEETYSIPLVPPKQSGISLLADSGPSLQIENGSVLVLVDAFSRQEFLAELLDIIKREGEVEGGTRRRPRRSRGLASSASGLPHCRLLSLLKVTIRYLPLSRSHDGSKINWKRPARLLQAGRCACCARG